VESAPGEGAKFHVYLPAVERPAPPEAKALSLKDAPGGTETILVAEDEDVVRRVVVYLLENAGYQVIVAHDGQEALTLYEQRREQIDLALLDIAMPRKSGRDVCEFIREHDERLPILFSSGHTSGIVDEAFLQRMSTELIRKPYQPNELLTRVRQLLD
jgi:CheY-like chemotaxis protein